MRTRIKICGITCLEDAQFAVSCGVDALGFMFYEPSKRFIDVESARNICRELPPCVSKVGVFVNASKEQVIHTQEACGLDVLQFHGEESPDWCQQFDAKTMKAFRVGDAKSLEAIDAYDVDAWLVDSYTGRAGGDRAFLSMGFVVSHSTLSKASVSGGGVDARQYSGSHSRGAAIWCGHIIRRRICTWAQMSG
jgi:phosphoribosylanthranilate isomerase